VFRDLIEFGWYIERDGKTLGPFTPSRLLDMRGEALVTKNTLVRQGPKAEWIRFADAHESILQIVQNATQAAAQQTTTPSQEPSQQVASVAETVEPVFTAEAEPEPSETAMPTIEIDGPLVVPTPRSSKAKKVKSAKAKWLSEHVIHIVVGVLLLSIFGIVIKAYSPVAAVGKALETARRSEVVTSIIPRGEFDTEELVSRTSESVALINAGASSGTGFMVDKQLLVTNYHVIADAEAYSIEIVFPDGRPGKEGPFSAVVIAESPGRDLALLKLSTEIPAVELDAKHSFRRGQEVVIIGSPGVFEGREVLPNAVTKGVLSSEVNIQGFQNYQLSAAVNPGNSGGPVFGMDGRVIGVVVMKSTSEESIAFCIPASELASFIKTNAAAATSDTTMIRSRHNARMAVRQILDHTLGRAMIIDAISQKLRSEGVDLQSVAMRDLANGEIALTGSNSVLRRYDLATELSYLLDSMSLSPAEKSIVENIFQIYRQTNALLDNPPKYFDQFSNDLNLESEQLLDAISQLNNTLQIGRDDVFGE
jgi:S1-C subfamily serine protease